MDITNRHKLILDAIISMYMLQSEPVASQSLLDKLDISVSSATLRNEMALLTKLGYLNQPHVAAGRIPTNKAYRYYVEHMDLPKSLDNKEKEIIKEQFSLLDGDSQRLLSGASKLFSDMYNVTCVVSKPIDIDMKFANFTFLKTGRYTVVIVAVTLQGDVHTRVVRINHDISSEQLNELSRFVNMKLCFVSYLDVDTGYFKILLQEFQKENRALSQILTAVLSLIKQASTQNFYTSGQENLLNVVQGEKGLSNLLKLLSNYGTLKEIITPSRQGVSVVFGDELPIEDIQSSCFISTNYYGMSGVKGTICIICPQATDYQKMILRVEYFAKLITDTIIGTERE